MAPAKNVRLNRLPTKKTQGALSFGRAVERDAHPIEQIDDLRRPLAISSTGGWSARKSPPSTVSSKCSHSLYPCWRAISLQALMPPCAQTLWLRLTGTIEKRSTPTPSSASLIVQASPASPPPTTITRLCDDEAMFISMVHGHSPATIRFRFSTVNFRS